MDPATLPLVLAQGRWSIPPNAGADLFAFGAVAAALILFGALRLYDPEAVAWRLGFRIGLWLAAWQGIGLTVRMAGLA